MELLKRYALPAGLALLLAGCGKKADEGAPLAYVPADTPYVIASLEAVPEAALEDRFRAIQPLWKPYFAQIDSLLGEAAGKAKDDAEKRALAAVRAVLDEFRERDSLAKWKEIGLDPQGRSALYGIGLAPVMRLELADAGAFRALIGRIEGKLGQPLPKASVAGQEYWRLGADDVPFAGLLALEGKHLVVALAPRQASEGALKELLGLTRPTQSMADGKALRELARERGYQLQGVGYLDTARLLERLAGEHRGVDGEFATALSLPTTAADAVCRAELAALAARMPRTSFGYTHFDASEQSFLVEFDLDAALRQQLAPLATAVPGMGSQDDALLDLALALPVLKWKDFWIKQSEAVAAAPFRCESLAKLNQGFADMKQGLDRTVPPPLSNLLGLRLTLDSMELSKDGLPDPAHSGGRMLIASDNPLLMVSMAQLAAPPLKDLRLALDGKPVAVPTGAVPLPQLPVYVAGSANALALAAGQGAGANLPPYLAAVTGDGKDLLHMRITGAFYGVYGDLLGNLMDKSGGEHSELIELQRQMYQRYRDWMAYTDVRLALGPHGLALHQTTRFNPPKAP